MRKLGNLCLTGTSCGFAAVITVPGLLGASAAGWAQGAGLEEIVVTARRAQESLLDTPASVAVYTQADIEDAGITSIADAIELTPGVSIITNTAEVGDTQINIRGINGARDAESSVALVVDGILKTNVSALSQIQRNATQMEILKGPQGAYYGRNAAAGAIVISTRKPSQEAEFDVFVSAGNNDTQAAELTFSGPLGETAGLLLSADYLTTSGFYRNSGPVASARGATVDQYDGYNLNGRFVYEPSDRFDLDLKARYGKVESGSINYNVVFNLPAVAGAFGAPAFNEDVNERDFEYLSNIASDGNQETLELSARANLDLGWATLTAWTLYSDVKQDLIADAAVAAFGFFNAAPECRESISELFAAGTAVPPPLFIAPTPEQSLLGGFSPAACDGTQYQLRNQEDFSVEARLASNADAPVGWSVGAYYLRIDREVGVALGYDRGRGIIENLFNGPDTDNPTEQLAHDNFTTDVYAVFGSLDYDVSDRLALSAALRYDREERKVRNLVDPDARSQFARGGNQPLNVGLDFGPLLPQSETFDEWQPRLSLSYNPAENWTLYGAWGVGFKSGGFNNQGSQATIESIFNSPAVGAGLSIQDSFDEETSNAFELGFKASLLDNRLRLEGAAYHTEVSDLQFFEFYAGPFGILRVVSNIDDVEVTGFELGSAFSVTERWRIYAGLNINDSEIKTNSARPGTEGGKSPHTPDYTGNIGTSMSWPVGQGMDFFTRIDYQHVGPTWFSTAQGGERPTFFNLLFGPELGVGNYALSERDDYGLINLRFGLRAENWSVTGFVNNATKEDYIAEVIPAPEFGGSFVSPGGRQAYGIEIGYQF